MRKIISEIKKVGVSSFVFAIIALLIEVASVVDFICGKYDFAIYYLILSFYLCWISYVLQLSPSSEGDNNMGA